MEVNVTRVESTDACEIFEMTCGKKSAIVSYSKRRGQITVCCKNASNRVWGGYGKFFWSFGEAISNYKTATMKAMITYAENAITEGKVIRPQFVGA